MINHNEKKVYLNQNIGINNNGIEDKAENVIIELRELKNQMEKKIDLLANSITKEVNGNDGEIVSHNYSKDTLGNIMADNVKNNMSSNNMISYYNSKIKNNMEEKNEITKETTSLSNMLSNYSSVFNNFYSSSKKEYNSFWLLRAFVSVLILALAWLSYVLFDPILAKVNVSSGEVFIRTLPMFITFALVVYYIFMEKQHFKRSLSHKDLSLKLSLLDTYLIDIPKNEADLIKIELAKYFFNSISKS